MPDQHVDAASVRLVVQAQPTVVGSLAAMMQAMMNATSAALAKPPDIGPLAKLNADMEAEPKAWVDAVLANTPSANLSAGFVSVPGYLAAMFEPTAEQMKAKEEHKPAAPAAHR